MSANLYLGDCLEVLATLPENSVDTCITDPPYGLGFMGKQWDTFDKSQFGVAGNEGENDLKVKKSFNILPRYRKDGLQEFTFDWATEVYRVLKPGAILLAFGGTRTYHRIACAIEDAGFEIRDTIAWVYGSGFPKSYNIEKGGAGEDWHGWGTALKPAFEPIVVAMKPIDGTFVNNALTWGVAGLWIDGGRVGSETITQHGRNETFSQSMSGKNYAQEAGTNEHQGRFPANFIHDGSDEVVGLFPNSVSRAGNPNRSNHQPNGNTYFSNKTVGQEHNDSGSAARFFYCAKASRKERNAGLEGMPEKDGGHYAQDEWSRTHMGNKPDAEREPVKNNHPTVKPIELMRYLVRLTKTPTGGVVLDPFTGSGTTGIACELEGREFIGIEREAEYVEIAEKRIAHYRLPILEEVIE